MEKYNYLEHVTSDVKDYINFEINMSNFSSREELSDYLYEHLWNCDSVTGNGSGSYTCNAWTAEENLCHNLDLLVKVFDEWGTRDGIHELDSPESCDVVIRCFLLRDAINEVLDELWVDEELDD